MGGNLNFVAAGNIAPCRFVTRSGAGNSVVQADAGSVAEGDPVIGISQQGQRNINWAPLQDGYCAIDGENLRVYQEEEVCLLELGGTIAFGQYLKSDANGKGVIADTDKDRFGAIAQEAGVSGQQIKVQVRIGMMSI